ncbi:glycosyltransferase [Persicitalea jodogahamensis]|uniref:Glycosyl transferase n=1 Tax=Persicitalea jodogahamensis TaxID=402147 RepID=A0A8J3GAL5_9BACT|nr:glycosyltransferase [Persicitalea jodogahamensis]GHB80996.1 glycosyl transferase [Persicitalea jodogahamensis]
MRKYSIVVPVYNRPDELDELLSSLTHQVFKNFEVIVVEDGSNIPATDVVAKYIDQLDINYFEIENVGQGFARNYGFSKANGDYLIVFDSDTIIPAHYLQAVDAHLENDYLDAFGGPDQAAGNFSELQKAISYAMTSFFTTGGIRGKSRNAGGAFQPRSFNMGMSKQIFDETGGFAKRDMGEDIEFGIRLKAKNYRTALIPEAYVYHKRRGNFRDFWRQVHSFGRTRFILDRIHPGQGLIKPVHAFPALFTIYCALIPLWFFILKPIGVLTTLLLAFFVVGIFLDASLKSESLKVGALSVMAAFVQLIGYGTGFIREGFRRLFGSA